jgi:D-3-phosphoglycerate dehydrogenase
LNEKSFENNDFFTYFDNSMKIGIVGSIHELGWEVLQSQGHTIIDVKDTSAESLKNKLAEVSGIVLRTAQMPNEVIDACPHLQIIGRHGVGYDNVDLNYLNKKKIALGVTGTANAVSVAEHVMTFFLQLTKNIHLSDELTRKGKFQEKGNLPSFYELYQKNVLILGFGRIGQAVAKRCLGFEMNVYVYDPYVSKETIEKMGCRSISIEDSLKLADFVSVHLPLNEETRNFINAKSFQEMKDSCVIVNTARGGIINEQDLYQALKDKKLRAAGLDVYEQEPPPSDHPLFDLSNVLLTPHNAALTLECRMRMAVEVCETVSFYLKNKEKLNLQNIINRKELGI